MPRLPGACPCRHDSGRLYFHWQDRYDAEPITSASDPRLRGDASPTAAEILAAGEGGLHQRLRAAARRVAAHGAPQAEYRTTWQSGAVLFHNVNDRQPKQAA